MRNSHLKNSTAIFTETVFIKIGSLDKYIQSMKQTLGKIKL